MTDEEKKAIEILKDFKKNGFHLLNLKYESRVSTTKHIENSIEAILNLIEKQQKEIEHWKAGMNIVEKDKNNHIERLEKEIERLEKEIEVLKDKFSDEKIRNTVIKRYREVIEKDYVSKDKIKAKIEEVNIKFENYEADKINIFSGQTYMEKFKLLGELYGLQSLIEKE